MLNPAMSPRRLPAVVPPPSPRPAGARGRWHAVAGAPTRAGAAAILGPPTARETSGGRRTAGGSRDRGDAVATAAKRGGGAWGHPRCPPAGGLPWGMGTFCYGGGGGLGDTVPLGTPGWGAWGHCAMGGVPHSQCPIPSATYSQCPQSSFPVPPVPIPSAPYSQHPKSPFPVLPIPSTPSSHSQCPHPHTHGSDSWADFRSPLKGRGAPSPAAGAYRRTPGSPRSVQGGAMVTAWGEGRCPPAPGDRHWDGDTSSPAGGLQPPSC